MYLVRRHGGITETGGWVNPGRESPTTPNTLYAGFVNLWRSTNGGVSWIVQGNIPFAQSTMIGHCRCLLILQVIWAAKGGTLYKTTNGGGSWAKWSTVSSYGGSYFISLVTIRDANKVWVTFRFH